MSAFASFADLAAHLDRLGLFRVRPELGRLRLVLAALADRLPSQNSPAHHPANHPAHHPAYHPAHGRAVAVQIAGTNGKGSTSTFIASLAAAHGLRVGLFTSPHFVSFRERIRLNGHMASEAALLEEANLVMDAGGETLTYFEFVTVLAALFFAREKAEVVVWETGLGGTWDAATALDVDMVAYTPIGLDHCAILGDTLGAIATDKAGAMRETKPVFSSPQLPEALHALEKAAHAKKCPFHVTAPLADDVPLGLFGEHQKTNAGLALAVWREMAKRPPLAERLAAAKSELTEATLPGPKKYGPKKCGPETYGPEEYGLATAFIPARLQYVPPQPAISHSDVAQPAFLLDGAHNGHGMAALGKALAQAGISPGAVIFSCLEDKLATDLIPHLRVLATGPIFVPPIPGNPRALPPETIAEAIGLAATPAASMEEAIRLAAAHIAAYLPQEAAARPARHPVLICGSLYMLGDFFALRPDCLDPQRPGSEHGTENGA
ncbi:MAG: Folylpolyglutamate synthase [Desulfovibrio sp.]